MRALALLPLLSACNLFERSWVERVEVDQAMAKGDYKTVCIGLRMKDDAELRTYTAQQLAPIPEPVVEECICEALQVDEKGKWDKAVAEGLRGAERDENVRCLVDLAKKADLVERDKAIGVLARVKAPSARATLLEIAKAPGDAAIRKQAILAFVGDKTQKDTLVGLMADADKDARAAAAAALGGIAASDPSVVPDLVRVATTDAEGAVRGAALLAARQSKSKESAELACKMLLEDAAPEVRLAALNGFRGTREAEDLACLRKRMLMAEDDPAVRQAMLDVVKASPSDESGKILCDAIPFWLKTYLGKGLPDQVPGTDIIRAQNDRDWEQSFACLQKAQKGSGYSCYAKQYLGTWVRELGGNAGVPKCPPPGL